MLHSCCRSTRSGRAGALPPSVPRRKAIHATGTWCSVAQCALRTDGCQTAEVPTWWKVCQRPSLGHCSNSWSNRWLFGTGWSPLGVGVPRARRRGRQRRPRGDLRQLEAVAGWTAAVRQPRAAAAPPPLSAAQADAGVFHGRRQSKRQRDEGVAAEGAQQHESLGRAAQRPRGDSSAAAAEPLQGAQQGGWAPSQPQDNAHLQPAAWAYPALPDPPQLPNGTRQPAGVSGNQTGLQHGWQPAQLQPQQQQHQQAAQGVVAQLPPPPPQAHQQQAGQSLASPLPPEQQAALQQAQRQRLEQQQGSQPDAQVCCLSGSWWRGECIQHISSEWGCSCGSWLSGGVRLMH
jgi:hypothetical protein